MLRNVLGTDDVDASDAAVITDDSGLDTALKAGDAAENVAQSSKAATIQPTQTSPPLTAMRGNLLEEATTLHTADDADDIITDLDADVRSGIMRFDPYRISFGD